MIKINAQSIHYYSYLDEKSFFEWAAEIPCVESTENGFLHLESNQLSEPDLRDLIAIMFRYKVRMDQLKQFCTEDNGDWFKDENAYWYASVFGEKETN